MSDIEAQAFVAARIRALKIEKLVKDQDQLEPIIIATGGNPKAIEVALGVLKHEHRPLEEVIDDLYAARGELFDDLFARAWDLLGEGSRHILLAMTLFPTTVSGDALAAAANIHGFRFDSAVERLTDLALLDVQQTDLHVPARYALHPLVRAFAKARLIEQEWFEKEARARATQWYIQLTSRVGLCWEDVKKLELLDPERIAVHEIIELCFQNAQYSETIQLVRGAFYYFHVRALWGIQPPIHLMAAEAASKQGDLAEEVYQLSMHIQDLGMQGNIAEADLYLAKLARLQSPLDLPGDILANCQLAVLFRSIADNKFKDAEEACRCILSLKSQISDIHLYIAGKHWLATCLYRQGLLEQAEQVFQEALADASQYGYQRSVVYCQINLATIALEKEMLETAEQLLKNSDKKAHEYHDRRYIAIIQRTFARLYCIRGNYAQALRAFENAIDLFTRMGMLREQAEAKEGLAQLRRKVIEEVI